MGTETEYGIAVPGQTSANHMLASSQIVNAYLNATTAGTRDRRPRWDFEEESPLRDARGFDMAGGAQVGAGRDAVDTLADDEIGLANVILTNGARLYVDHAHPEYSTPEVTNPRDAVLWDKAGERVMAGAAGGIPSLFAAGGRRARRVHGEGQRRARRVLRGAGPCTAAPSRRSRTTDRRRPRRRVDPLGDLLLPRRKARRSPGPSPSPRR